MKKLGLFIGIVYLVTYMMAGCVGESENVSVLEAGREVAVDEMTENIEKEDTRGTEEDAMEEIVYSEYSPNGELVEGELWADFGYSNAPMVEKQLLCMDSQGNISEVGKDWGFGPIYIMNVNENGPKMYSTLIDTDGMYKIHVYDIYTGNVEYLYSSEETIEILRCYDDKIAFEQGYYNLCCIDLGQSPVVQVDMGGYWKEEFLGMDERAVYYVGHQYSENADFYICESSYAGEEKVLAELEIIDIVPDDMRKEELFFSVEISDHDMEQDVGWRYYYTRRMTYDYYKNLSTGEIILMQSY